MDERLSQAIAAARTGQKEDAQQLLAQLLQDNPDDAQGWFLLSNLVDDPAQKQVFLGRVLALDPEHAMATTQWAAMHQAAPADTGSQPAVAVSTSDDLMEQAEGGTLPDWLADDADKLRIDESQSALAAELDELAAETEAEEIPDWLSEDADVAAEEETMPPVADEETAVAPKPSQRTLTSAPAPDGKPRPTTQERSLTIALYILSGVAVLVFLALIYLVITNL